MVYWKWKLFAFLFESIGKTSIWNFFLNWNQRKKRKEKSIGFSKQTFLCNQFLLMKLWNKTEREKEIGNIDKFFMVKSPLLQFHLYRTISNWNIRIADIATIPWVRSTYFFFISLKIGWKDGRVNEKVRRLGFDNE